MDCGTEGQKHGLSAVGWEVMDGLLEGGIDGVCWRGGGMDSQVEGWTVGWQAR